MDVWSLPRLLPEESRLSSPAHRTIRLHRMGRTHLLNGARAWSTRISKDATSNMVCHVRTGQAQGKRKTFPRRIFYTFGIFLFLPSVTHAPSWSIKGRAGPPIEGTDFGRTSSTHNTSHIRPSSDQALGVLLTIPSETWDISLSRPFVPPTTNLFRY